MGQIKIDPTLLERVEDTLKALQPRDPAQLDGPKIKEMIDRSGVHYDAKVKNLNFKGLTAGRRVELGQDFKGQLLELAKTVEAELSKANLPDVLIRQGSELLTQVRQAIQSIEFQQTIPSIFQTGKTIQYCFKSPILFLEKGKRLKFTFVKAAKIRRTAIRMILKFSTWCFCWIFLHWGV